MPEWIEQNPAVMMGKPVVKGTRITVEHILRELAAGATIEDLLLAHSRLNRDAISDALNYAADVLRDIALNPSREVSD